MALIELREKEKRQTLENSSKQKKKGNENFLWWI